MSTTECSCSLSRCRHRLGAARNELECILRHASLRELDKSRNRFIPIGELNSQLDFCTIRESLRVFLDPQSYTEADIDRMAYCISPPIEKCSRCANGSCTSLRILFVALVAVEKEQLITHFCNSRPNICDTTWPVRNTMSGLAHNISLSELWKSFTAHEKEIFAQVQWKMRSPHFSVITPDEDPKSYDNEVSMPWVLLGGEKKAPGLPDSFVHKLRIHGTHHQLGRPDACFALKVLEKKRVPSYGRRLFDNEVKANQKVSHPHITPLLAAFTHRSDFYLVLPWANDGNLRQFWKTYAPYDHPDLPGKIAPWYSVDWMARQCYFIADALATIHGSRLGEGSRCSAPQLHADIRPENILCFSEGEATCSLKISDFDRSIPFDPQSGLQGEVDEPKSYRPPESDEQVGLEWDIWSLGCLYVEFVTWALTGYSGVVNFGEARLEEVDAQDPNSPFNPVEEDLFFSRQRIPPRWRRLRRIPPKTAMKIKSAVTRHLQNLRGHPRCALYMRKLLDLAETKMLVVDVGGRATSADVRGALHQLLYPAKPT
ncbi:Serine/threonine-protein kinase Aurora-2 [Colletotrichum trifolii]|uniref:Serine/threonine-protein kinase Aurora-2 n=1 Tax=Colletotrichum trifolii TaxID=5466 RepID=A0A4V3HVQ2_COLTR|nr:Serine/threonine-protein kinase Aurora-2 [Colletotrichum trifolii]